MGDQFIAPLPACSNVNPPDIVQSSTIIEEGPRICPLCNSIVKFFFINFNDKIVMCENADCEFPFGHEELQFYKADNEVGTDEEVKSVSVRDSVTGSIITAAEWMDIDKINRAYDSEDNQSEYNEYTKKKLKEIYKKEKETKQQITKNIQTIKQLNEQLCMDELEELGAIRNEKWIKNLLDLQESSGVKLLKEQELVKLRKKEPEIGLGELKIDINSKENSMSTIKIELKNFNTEIP